MRLLEYESKQVFEEYNIPLANRVLIKPEDNIEEKVQQFSFPAIVKSQIAIGSRKKAGLIEIAKTEDEAIRLCKEFFSREVGGFKVEAILIEELAQIEHEYYCSIALDSSGRRFLLMASAEGGIDIEEVAVTKPEAIIKEPIALTKGLDKEKAMKVAQFLKFEGELANQAVDLFLKLWKITVEKEAQLVEINPLVRTPSGLIAVDGKMILDDNAAFRQELTRKLREQKLSELEKIAEREGFSFVQLDGEIGILANGAGLTMALLDVLSEHGLKPANFLDVGGGASAKRVYEALKLLFRMKPKAVLINIYGGITRCDVVAEGILHALKEFENPPPMVIRLTGTKESEGVQILNDAGIKAYRDMMDAVEQLKNIVKN